MRTLLKEKTGRWCAVVAVAMSVVAPCYSRYQQSERRSASLSKESPEKKRAGARERDNRGVGELRKLSDLKAMFDRDNGKVRLVVLVSPT